MTTPLRRFGGALAGHGGVTGVGRHLHVVDGAGVDLDRIGLDDVAGLGDVPDEAVAVGALGPGECVVAPVHALEDPEVGGADALLPPLAVDLELLDDVAQDDAEGGARGERPRVGDDGVDAGHVGDEAAAVHLCGCGRRDDPFRLLPGVGPLDGNAGEEAAVRAAHLGAEFDDVAGAGARHAAGDGEGGAGEGVGGEGERAVHAVDGGGDGGRAGGVGGDAPEAVDGGDAGGAAAPLRLGAGPGRAVGVFGAGAQPEGGAREEAVAGGGRDGYPGDGGPADRDGDAQRDGGGAGWGALLDQGRDEREFARREGGDGAVADAHAVAGTDKPYGGRLDADAGARDPGHRDRHFVSDPHGEFGGCGFELCNGVVQLLGGAGICRQRGQEEEESKE